MTAKPPRTNVPSVLLTSIENETIFRIIGGPCTTLATTVVQLYLSNHEGHNKWNKQCCGVVCYIKDNAKRSFFIRIYDIMQQKMIFEQELYTQFVYKIVREYFHTFETDNCQAGMNFASDGEAIKFKIVVEERLRERSRKRKERREQEDQAYLSGPPTKRRAQENRTLLASPPTKILTTIQSVGSAETLFSEQKTDSKTKLTKADIGPPLDLRLATPNLDSDEASVMSSVDADMQILLMAMDIGSDVDVDRETLDFISDFMNMHGGMETAIREIATACSLVIPPPLPTNPPPGSRELRRNTEAIDPFRVASGHRSGHSSSVPWINWKSNMSTKTTTGTLNHIYSHMKLVESSGMLKFNPSYYESESVVVALANALVNRRKTSVGSEDETTTLNEDISEWGD